MAKSDKSRQPQGLSIEQQNAIDLLIQGKTDAEVGTACGVTRQTICFWRHNHAEFIAELSLRREALFSTQAERLRVLVARAVDVLDEGLDNEDPRLRQSAAVHILRAAGLYKLAPPEAASLVQVEERLRMSDLADVFTLSNRDTP